MQGEGGVKSESLAKLENWQNLRSRYSEGGVSTSRFGEFTRHKFSRLALIAALWVHRTDGWLVAEDTRRPFNEGTGTKTWA